MPAPTPEEIKKLTDDFLAALDKKKGDEIARKTIVNNLPIIRELANNNNPKALFCLIELYGGAHNNSASGIHDIDRFLQPLEKLGNANNREAMELLAKHYERQANLPETVANAFMITRASRAESVTSLKEWRQKAADAKLKENNAPTPLELTSRTNAQSIKTAGSTISRTPGSMAPPPSLSLPPTGFTAPAAPVKFDPLKQLNTIQQAQLIHDFRQQVNEFIDNNSQAAEQFINNNLSNLSILANNNHPSAIMALLVYYSDQRSKTGARSTEYNYWMKKLDMFATADKARMREFESAITDKKEMQVFADYYEQKIEQQANSKNLSVNKDAAFTKNNFFGFRDWTIKAAKNDMPKAIYNLCLLYALGRPDLKFALDHPIDQQLASRYLLQLHRLSNTNEEAKKYFENIKANNIPGLREKIVEIEAVSIPYINTVWKGNFLLKYNQDRRFRDEEKTF